jgi:hypothetical protein
MNLEDVKRWQELEQRARGCGWTIGLLDVDVDCAATTAGDAPARRRAFALMELTGNERTLLTGDLNTIETFL